MGISAGTNIICWEKLFKGPIIVKHKRQEIAIGNELAKNIEISPNKI
jgi:Fe2+ transport system protein FeoA